jgi:hypothetical protein
MMIWVDTRCRWLLRCFNLALNPSLELVTKPFKARKPSPEARCAAVNFRIADIP